MSDRREPEDQRSLQDEAKRRAAVGGSPNEPHELIKNILAKPSYRVKAIVSLMQ
jgi:hypothetical protein